tara:strand:+ start:5840 stop:5962 length:123 start_codon:yes stop_codon:yes gene_type:complete
MDGTIGFLIAIFGFIAFVRLEKLIKELKKKGILDKDYNKE